MADVAYVKVSTVKQNAVARRDGKYQVRQLKRIDDRLWKQEYQAYKNRGITKKDFAYRLGVSRPTLDKLLKEKRIL